MWPIRLCPRLNKKNRKSWLYNLPESEEREAGTSFVCPMCGKTLRYKSNLNRHVSSSYVCPMCDKTISATSKILIDMWVRYHLFYRWPWSESCLYLLWKSEKVDWLIGRWATEEQNHFSWHFFAVLPSQNHLYPAPAPPVAIINFGSGSSSCHIFLTKIVPIL